MERGMVPGVNSYGALDLQGSIRANNHPHHLHQHNQNPIHHHQSLHEGFPLTMTPMHDCEPTMSMVEYGKGEKGKNTASDDDDDEPSFTDDGKKGTMTWHRVKWTDKMVKLLITAVSYIGEDPGLDSARRKFSVLQKKGKWKSVSKVMAERGYHVSPQQCEDKFNDLNKRYKRLNDMLGRGTSCQVVENPSLLDMIDYLNDKEKDDVRKILSSKHLFYEEMCSYQNGNRLHLPHDPVLQRSLQLALRNREDHENNDDDHDAETDDRDELEENHASHGDCGKRFKPGQQCLEDVDFGNSLNKNAYSQPQLGQADNSNNPGLNDGTRVEWLQKQWIESRSMQLEERKLQIQVEMLELEKERLKWQKFSKKRDRELEKLRMENERMKLENDHMAMEIKRKEMGVEFS